MSIETGGNNPLANLFFSSQRLLIVLPDFPWNTLDGGSLNSTEGILAEYRALPNPLQSPGRIPVRQLGRYSCLMDSGKTLFPIPTSGLRPSPSPRHLRTWTSSFVGVSCTWDTSTGELGPRSLPLRTYTSAISLVLLMESLNVHCLYLLDLPYSLLALLMSG